MQLLIFLKSQLLTCLIFPLYRYCSHKCRTDEELYMCSFYGQSQYIYKFMPFQWEEQASWPFKLKIHKVPLYSSHSFLHRPLVSRYLAQRISTAIKSAVRKAQTTLRNEICGVLTHTISSNLVPCIKQHNDHMTPLHFCHS